ncbi:MAG: glycoside hydrolase family 3 C-terminal domain-containing protein [Bacteroidetes bacterium]|nr:glycoside hydrolase family 3 C-terminal domain-containing protein [Bacteroidota bacterium]
MRKFRSIIILVALLLNLIQLQGWSQAQPEKFRDYHYPVQGRVDDLVSRLTLEEKVAQMQNDAPAIPRFGIPAYNWWNECLHGVARNGVATVFPQAIGMAATWDPDLIFKEADVISTEARAKYNSIKSTGKSGIYQGLTFWSPNINIFRDPRWGRGQETYGEDPFLTARIGVAFVKGLQGNDPRYFKVISTAKHFAVHSGPEPARHKFDAWCSEKDLYETYLPAFEALITEGKAYSVMGAYNRLYNVPCCASDFLLDEILRKKWGFQGYVVSDCGAIWDIYHGHALVENAVKASVLGLKAGLDLTCGNDYGALTEAVKSGYISEELIDLSVKRLFTARFRLGMFDPENVVPWSAILPSENDKEEHRALARKVAQESIVLLKNENQLLPLSGKIKSIAVIGPYADKLNVLKGNYNGDPSKPFTLLQGIKNRAGKKIRVGYAMGVPALEDIDYKKNVIDWMPVNAEKEALALASASDVIIFTGGISPDLEGEEMPFEVHGFSGGDRTLIDIPNNQAELLKKLQKTGKPVILVLTGGSALSFTWAKENIPAILDVWYAGEEGGNALADVLFGDYNPAGRLPVTFYKSDNDLPPFGDYSMKGRTYRYFNGEPLYPFGYGLSYTSFTYLSAEPDKKSAAASDTIMIRIMVKNTGTIAGDEVVQLYSKCPGDNALDPIKSLVAFKRIGFKRGEEKTITLSLPVKELRQWDYSKGDYTVAPGTYHLFAGGSSQDLPLHLKIQVEPK